MRFACTIRGCLLVFVNKIVVFTGCSVVSLRTPKRTSTSLASWLLRESLMSKDESTDERTARQRFAAWLQEIEAAAAELVEVGDLLFRSGEPSDPALLRRYRLYKRVKAAVALPPGPERVGALQAAKIDDRRKH
jgi:hypothetical protein